MRTIAYITDIHLDEAFPREQGIDAREHLRQILEDVARRGITEVIFGGDIGAQAANPLFFESLRPYKLRLVLGNHDAFDEVSQHFKIPNPTAATALYYADEDACFRYLFLDSSAEAISQTQLAWVQAQLQTDKPLIIFIHHPILAVPTPIDKAYPLHGREQLQEVLHQCQLPVTIFCGHYHMADERQQAMLKQYISPAGSFQINKEASGLQVETHTFGYRILELQAQEIHTKVLLYQQGRFVEAAAAGFPAEA